jgi:hypothetical protein
MRNRHHNHRARVLTTAAQDRDAQYFLDHPSAHSYVRAATRAELRATGLPPGTRVYVVLVGRDTRVRGFLPPNVRRN